MASPGAGGRRARGVCLGVAVFRPRLGWEARRPACGRPWLLVCLLLALPDWVLGAGDGVRGNVPRLTGCVASHSAQVPQG